MKNPRVRFGSVIKVRERTTSATDWYQAVVTYTDYWGDLKVCYKERGYRGPYTVSKTKDIYKIVRY